jgi:mRNA interferase RelE/StbE
MTSYEVAFVPSARREWEKLGATLKVQFHKKLQERTRNPHVPGDKLVHMPGCYRIKLRSSGYRLIYEVEDKRLVVIVLSVGPRERNKAYRKAAERRGTWR